MAKKKVAALADVPFYDYLWQFYAQNRRKTIWMKVCITDV